MRRESSIAAHLLLLLVLAGCHTRQQPSRPAAGPVSQQLAEVRQELGKARLELTELRQASTEQGQQLGQLRAAVQEVSARLGGLQPGQVNPKCVHCIPCNYDGINICAPERCQTRADGEKCCKLEKGR